MVLLEVSSVLLTISKLMDVPSEYQIPLAALVVAMVCLALVGAGITVQQASPKKVVTINAPQTPGTPPKTPPSKKAEQLGTVTTPAGRRSARLARRRKED